MLFKLFPKYPSVPLREVIKNAESVYAHYVNSENLLIQAFPNEELKEEFPKEDPNRIPDTIREYKAETNRQEEHSEEFLEHPNPKVDAENITFREYSLLGELPISDKSGILIRSMAHLLASIGHNMKLTTCKRGILQLVLDQYKQIPIVQLKKELQNDYNKNRIL